MKRRLVEQGGVTLMLSMPREWTKKHRLKKGDEVEILEKDNNLLVAAEKVARTEATELDITNLSSLINFGLSALYVKGVDELTLTSQNPELIQKLPQKPLNQFIGFEIIEQSKNRLVTKDLSGMQHVEFQPMLRRVFLLLQNMYDELAKGIENHETNFDHIVSMDLNVNRFCFLCLRMLNKKGYEDFKHTQTMFLLVTFLEQIGDQLKEFADYITTRKVVFSDKEQKDFRRVVHLFIEYQSLFFKFNVEKAVKIDSSYRKFHNEFETLLDHTKSPSHVRALLYFDSLAKITAELLRTQLMMVL
ncbi:TPA: phosphate uptake regulator PhoU [Candidatus Woesearchaeota archaeon]|nr:phosphate uptake regulator PhoU [Candidatus Woesearchaeota archaeon]